MPEPITVDIHAFRENLSRYIADVQHGALLMIVSHGKPVASVTAVSPARDAENIMPRYGALKGQIWIADDFDDLDEGFVAAYEGDALIGSNNTSFAKTGNPLPAAAARFEPLASSLPKART